MLIVNWHNNLIFGDKYIMSSIIPIRKIHDEANNIAL